MGDRLPHRCEVELDFDRYEYRTTEGQRKCWYGEPDLTEEGWEEYAEWERFDYTEERYWRRPLSDEQLAEVAKRKAIRARAEATSAAERKVIEAAKAWHAEHKEHDNDAIGMAIVNLARAAEALEAAEQEGE